MKKNKIKEVKKKKEMFIPRLPVWGVAAWWPFSLHVTSLIRTATILIFSLVL